MHWAERLAAFDLDVQYMRGLDNAVADALSRLPLPGSKYALPDVGCDITLKHISGNGLTLEEL